jgi:predicted DNA-binding transcriptional regulator AlpA
MRTLLEIFTFKESAMSTNKQTGKQCLRPKNAAAKLKIGLSSLWLKVKSDPDFPRPIKLSERTTVFLEDEIDEYIELCAGRSYVSRNNMRTVRVAPLFVEHVMPASIVVPAAVLCSVSDVLRPGSEALNQRALAGQLCTSLLMEARRRPASPLADHASLGTYWMADLRVARQVGRAIWISREADGQVQAALFFRGAKCGSRTSEPSTIIVACIPACESGLSESGR